MCNYSYVYRAKEFLFTRPESSWLWLLVRLYLASVWIPAGWGKIMNPAWVGSEAGGAITGFVTGALAKTAGEHPDVLSGYAWFLSNLVMPMPALWSHVVAFGELAVGLGLLFGVFTTAAVAGGLLMNFAFLFAGTVSINPLLVVLELPLLVAYRTSGRIGLEALWCHTREGKTKQ